MLDWLNAVPLAGLMLVITLGWSLGQLGVGGLSLGSAGATLFVALALGHLGLAVGGPPAASLGTLGFALFIYSVGFEAGPRFFASLFGGPGWRFVLGGLAVSPSLASAWAAAVTTTSDSLPCERTF